jgi:hypothetical protein
MLSSLSHAGWQTIVQSCQNVQTDYATYTLLLGPALCLVTAGMPPKLTEDLRGAIVGIARAQPPLAMAVLQASCRSLTSLAVRSLSSPSVVLCI